MNVRCRVELSQTERSGLTAFLSGGKHAARKLERAQILLAADAGGASDDDMAISVGVGGSTGYRTKQRFVLGNLAVVPVNGRGGEARERDGCADEHPTPIDQHGRPRHPWVVFGTFWSAGGPEILICHRESVVEIVAAATRSGGARLGGARHEGKALVQLAGDQKIKKIKK